MTYDETGFVAAAEQDMWDVAFLAVDLTCGMWRRYEASYVLLSTRRGSMKPRSPRPNEPEPDTLIGDTQ